MKIWIINGPNINFIGIREPAIYGRTTYEDMMAELNAYATSKQVEVEIRQSNHEGTLIDWIQEALRCQVDGIVINPGGYTHTSIALMDAILSIKPLPVIEVHLSDIMQREAFRHLSYTGMACVDQIKGHGIDGYKMAMDELIELVSKES